MTNDSFHLTSAAARKYDSHSVPAMFAPLARATMDKITLPEHAHIIDIACGTGALTRQITANLPGQGHITGVDLNASMIDIAREQQPDSPHSVTWLAADVCAIPSPDNIFDMAFIQQGLQFFPDKPAALQEVRRILKPGGRLVLTCWSAISAFNGALAEALAAHVGPDAAQKARAPFSFRDGAMITRLLTEAGFDIDAHREITLDRQFRDLRAQIMALPVEADLVAAGEATTDHVVHQVDTQLDRYRTDGILTVPQKAHLFEASTPT